MTPSRCHTPHHHVPDAGSRWRSTLALVVVAAGGVILFLGYRIETPSVPLPVDRVLVSKGWADEQVCAECHEQAETFWSTGHALTLRRVTDATSKSLLETLEDVPSVREEGTRLSLEGDWAIAVNRRDGVSSYARVDWCFGSGHHAHTWVATLADSQGATDLLEFRWTWYEAIDGFDITPGQPSEMTDTYFGGLGLLFDQPKARRCFGCHATHVPVNSGQILGHAVKPGVTCQRCHGPRQAHIESEGEVIDSFWRNATQVESVNRCAECHRRADEEDAADISTDNLTIVRFQPVGLTQSACFQGSDMTCLTCHDPHQPLHDQDSTGIWQCVQCHDGAAGRHALCGAGHTDDCLVCHMPKVGMERPLRFTDHWIRVRDDDESTR